MKTGKKSNDAILSPAKKGKRKAGQWVWILCVSVFSLLIVAYGTNVLVQMFFRNAFYKNTDFAIQHIDVHVSGTTSKNEILRWSGVSMGQNLMALNLNAVRDRLLKIPYLSSASVERKLPDTLKISVEERQPIAIVQPKPLDGYRLIQSVYYIDSEGMIIKPKAGERLQQLPIITGIDAESVVEGSKLDWSEILSALNFIRLVEISPVRSYLDMTQIDVQSRGYLIVRTRNRGVIRFRLDYLDQQIQRLKVIFDFALNDDKEIRSVDLSPERNVPVTFF